MNPTIHSDISMNTHTAFRIEERNNEIFDTILDDITGKLNIPLYKYLFASLPAGPAFDDPEIRKIMESCQYVDLNNYNKHSPRITTRLPVSTKVKFKGKEWLLIQPAIQSGELNASPSGLAKMKSVLRTAELRLDWRQ